MLSQYHLRMCRLTVIFSLVLSITALPLAPSLSLAAETKDTVEAVTVEKSPDVPVQPEEHKSESEKVSASDQKKDEQADDGKDRKEGMSTLTKVGIGVGAVAVIGLAALAVSGGSGDSGPTPPTQEQILGVWDVVGTSQIDEHTYYGSYNFYQIGSHTFDIMTSYAGRKTGRGNWRIDEGTYTFHIVNDTGSHYVGEFTPDNYTTITVRTVDGRWSSTLTKR